ncbi:hypothetical protein M9Y10_035800 [Tritrichomonas musculus]|uniref:Adenylate and Guanylate cyclase catalytic domain containing protein n=1 Tax=Tritrichomonas musculus TaxID=1915356 RepID=A0ABR2GW23_9EUKA
MNNLEPSAASQSGTSARSEARSSSEGFISQHFDPFFDFFTQFIHPHSIFYFIYLIIFGFQMAYVSMWLHHTNFWIHLNEDKVTHTFSDLAKVIHYIAPFSPVYKTADDYFIPFIIFTVVVVLIIATIFFQLWFYKSQRRFSKFTLYPTRILIELITPIMLVPLSHITGHSLSDITSDDKETAPQMYAYFAVGLIEYIICICIFFYSSSIIGVSAFMSLSPLSVFDYKPYVYMLLSTSVFSLFEVCFVLFPAWTSHPLVVFHICFGCFIAYRLTFQPFTSVRWNCFFMTFSVFSVLLDVLKLITNFFNIGDLLKDKKNCNELILIANLVCFFGLLVISIVVSVVYSVLRFKKLNQVLNSIVEKDNDQNSEGAAVKTKYTDEERTEIFLNLKLDHSELMALSVLYYVTQNHLVPYLDFCLIKFILNSHKTVDAMMQCMRLISYFPSNSRYLNMLFNIIVKRRDTKFTHRFFIYQIQKIKLLRQSSSSLIACERLNELNEKTVELEEEVVNFWLLGPSQKVKGRCCCSKTEHKVDVTYLYQLKDRMNKTRSLWDEALIDFPNSIPYREEYCHFFIECQTDFANAIKNKHKSDMIESGRNFSVDMCFRLFVKNFPQYLKKHIIDVKGNFFRDSKKQGGGHSSVSSNNSSKNSFSSSNTSSSVVIDGQVEEEIGRSLINQSRIRLAMQKSTQTKKANKLAPLIFVTAFLFVIGLFCAFFIYVYFKDYFANRTRSMTRIELVNKVQLYTYTSALLILYKWGNITHAIDIDSFSNELRSKDLYKDSDFLPFHIYDRDIARFNANARDIFGEFLIDVSKLSEEGVNVFKYGDTLFSDTTHLTYCNATSQTVPPFKTNLKTTLLFIFMSQSQIVNLNESNIEDMFYNNIDYCHILVNLMNIYESFQTTRDLLIEMDEKDSNDASDTIYKIKIGLSVAYAVVTVSLSCSFFFLYIHEIMHFVELLLNLPRDAKMNAMKPLRKYPAEESKIDKSNEHHHHEEQANVEMVTTIHHNEPDKKGKYSIPVLFCFIIFICFMTNIVLTYFQLENVQKYNRKYYYLNNWILNSRFRKVLVVRLTDWIMHAILLANPLVNKSSFIKDGDFDDLIRRNFNELNECSNKMLQGTDDIPSSNGEDVDIDKLTYQEVCKTNESDPTYHEMYRCGSLRNLLTFFTNSVNEMIVNNKEYQGNISKEIDEVPAQILHLATDHVIPRLNRIDERWDIISRNYHVDFVELHSIYMCCSLIVVIIAFILMIRLTVILTHAYKACLLLLRRVSPIAVINDLELVDYLLDKDEEKDGTINSTDQGIIKSSQDAIICLSSTGMIEIVNPSVNHLFGFTPDQLLGQPISTSLFDEKNGSLVNNQIFLMINKQAALSYEGHVTCLTDNDTEVPCQIMILGMTSDNDLGTIDDESSDDDEYDKKKKKNDAKGDIESFVIILRDETEMLKHQQIAEEAKKQSETLLYQILPRSVVIRLNQGEKDISFSVPSATIMFIDIVKFSDYAATLTPQEIMGNLSQIMGGYDDAIKKYDMLLKIKLIGDVYMCAGGLFNEEDPPASHAEQMTHFGLDALQNIEDMNSKLSSFLSVRIGINTGGPLIAGVLGTDKPTFDIIGDTINIASRLQSTDFPGKIQISQETYDLIKDLNFSIEPRGEVYLKGKGNQMAYIVSPSIGISFSLSQMGEDTQSSLI